MIERPYWLEKIHTSWKRAPIVWLTGVRRIGKTTLVRQLGDIEYINCDLPRNRSRVEDPELFFRGVEKAIIVFDEVHRLENPSETLKIGADEFPKKRILATGSSTLAATSKFRDTLTGRKRVIPLLPVLASELKQFGIHNLNDRLLHGGFPQQLLESEPDPEFFGEWLDSYYSRDVQELFAVAKRSEFLKLIELLLRNNGGFFEVSSLGKQTGLSRPTVMRYIDILELTHVIHRLAPFHGGAKREITGQPKIYGVDTGLVSYLRGWETLRPEDRGALLENLVLDELLTLSVGKSVKYWRDKSGREIDFVLTETAKSVTAVECKWSHRSFEIQNLSAFRTHYPKGKNIVVAADAGKPFQKRMGDFVIYFSSPENLRAVIY